MKEITLNKKMIDFLLENSKEVKALMTVKEGIETKIKMYKEAYEGMDSELVRGKCEGLISAGRTINYFIGREFFELRIKRRVS